jgi:arsenate reductase
LLKILNHDTSELRSKHWHEFTADDAPKFDFVFTVCDKAAGEPCPIWPGQPVRAHWGVEDPVMLYSSDENVQKLFFDTYLLLKRRIELFCNLPMAKLGAMAIKHHLDDIGLVTQATPMSDSFTTDNSEK